MRKYYVPADLRSKGVQEVGTLAEVGQDGGGGFASFGEGDCFKSLSLTS